MSTTDLPPIPELAARLRAWAAGYLPSMAAVELLIGHEHWLRRGPFLNHVEVTDTLAAPDWDALHQLLELLSLDTNNTRLVADAVLTAGGAR